jgi:hypothetical protein
MMMDCCGVAGDDVSVRQTSPSDWNDDDIPAGGMHGVFGFAGYGVS